MSESLAPDRPRQLLSELCRLVAERAPAELQIPADFNQRNETARTRYRDAKESNSRRYEQQKAANEEEYAATRSRALARFETEHTAAQREYDEVRRAIESRFRRDEKEANDTLQEARWEATTVFDATKGGPAIQLQRITAQLEAGRQELGQVGQQADQLLRRRWQRRNDPAPEATAPPSDAPALPLFSASLGRAKAELGRLQRQRVGRLFEGGRLLWFVVLFWAAAIYPCGAVLGWRNWYWVAASGGIGLVLTGALGTWLYRIARRQSVETFQALRQAAAEAEAAHPVALEQARAECERQYAAIVARRDDELKAADDAFAATMSELNRRKKDELWQADEKYPALLAAITARRDRDLKEAEDRYTQRTEENEHRHETEANLIQREYQLDVLESDQRFRNEWGTMEERWRGGVEAVGSAGDAMNTACDRLFPAWEAVPWDRWQAPGEVPPAIRFGRFAASLGQIEHGIPADEKLRPERTEFLMPALLPFPDRSLMMMKADGPGLARAVNALQAIMLRMLVSIPPAKVRFMILDPVGLGENFSAFMHLADYDEQLVSARIWTETSHIEQRLADLTQHMENVIQGYLRNEFRSILEYNAFAGEMAEPYRVLVVANFPAGFTETAARRLRSIVSSGARCGVFTLLSVDAKLELPRDFRLADLEPYAFLLRWRDGRFAWEHPDYGRLDLEQDQPPPPEEFTAIVRRVGKEAEHAGKVEVPFDCIVPEPDQRWVSSSAGELSVPLGRAGAMKLQHLNLGKGTSQHVLIAGKTGSGKSTLLHVLITSVAQRYTPDQVELYLVDFKKGVEFKAYANLGLPHARVIAIESEREFGLSVLERLDEELRRRGDLFRKHRVQDLTAFRAACPEAKSPRILLIIDEFQELFVEDDRIAQSAGLLLDRLVRQGRAFGIHVLLGSQTLAGAYSLARSTIGQMAVRIALQCSDADAHLILSEENTAARLLTRPGEAIYNDANGLFEGNHVFQVAWLPDATREQCLRQIGEAAQKRNWSSPPAIVFEGNVPADPTENEPLRELLLGTSAPQPGPASRAWLGAAVAIKEPTFTEFQRQSGSNLLMVGHREEAAVGILASALISLAAQVPVADPSAGAPGVRFFLLDGTRPDAPEAGVLRRVAKALPHEVQVVGPRRADEAIGRVAEELARREASRCEDAPTIFLVVYNLSRFRDVRKDEDDFGFSRPGDGEPASPSRQFATILREGPPLGIHTLLWCDSYNNVTRWLDRQALRDLEIRVLFQMNAADSSSLIDSPAAGRLGVHRAVLYDEGLGQVEKFRPYGLPSDAWLGWVKEHLHRRWAATGSHLDA